MNKEEAERCLGMAKAFMKAGQHDKAVRFFEKSERLYPLPGVQSLIARCRQEQAQAKSPRPSGPSAAQTEARENRARQESGADMRGGGTEKQKQTAKEILRSAKAGQNAHYKVLGIEKSASEADIKKAYRRRSLHVHPDKNPSAEAEEAFKAVGLAYSTLSDPAKRDTYDRFGDPDPAEGGGGAQGNPFAGMRRRGGGGMGQGDMDPDDVFRMFFGGGGAPGGGGGFGGPGFRVYSNGGGFGGFQQQRGGRRQERQEGGQEQGGGLGGEWLARGASERSGRASEAGERAKRASERSGRASAKRNSGRGKPRRASAKRSYSSNSGAPTTATPFGRSRPATSIPHLPH